MLMLTMCSVTGKLALKEVDRQSLRPCELAVTSVRPNFRHVTCRYDPLRTRWHEICGSELVQLLVISIVPPTFLGLEVASNSGELPSVDLVRYLCCG